jgi:hypothetical protein
MDEIPNVHAAATKRKKIGCCKEISIAAKKFRLLQVVDRSRPRHTCKAKEVVLCWCAPDVSGHSCSICYGARQELGGGNDVIDQPHTLGFVRSDASRS